MTTNPFDEIPSDIDAVIAIVKREASEECAADRCPVHWALEVCARDAVADLWDSRVKTFVPLLALRRVRGCIRAGTCDTAEW